MEIFPNLPKELVNFVFVVLFSLLIGLEQRRMHTKKEWELLFGTDRTLTLIGIFGYILYTIMPQTLWIFAGGGVLLTALLGIYYFNKTKLNNSWGITSILIALITYCLAPLVYLKPLWEVLLVVVTILIVVEIKEDLKKITFKFDRNEFGLLAKFIIISGIVLPLLPHKPISDFINISLYQVWISVVAVTGISYLSYLLRKFVFPNSGIFLSAILGGLYSSTVTTIILAKKSKEEANSGQIVQGILGATGMMYIRLLILAYIFNTSVAGKLLPYFLILIFLNVAYIGYLAYINRNKTREHSNVKSTKNPLEFKTALLFALLFAFFSVITGFVMKNYGDMGINILSFIVGVTDIDPYILSLFQNSGNIHLTSIVSATIIASASNNLIKMLYAVILGDKSMRKTMIPGFVGLIVVSLVMIWIF